MEPGRSAALKLVGGQTAESVMLFEETAPPGTATDFHLHHDSDLRPQPRPRDLLPRWNAIAMSDIRFS